VSIKREIAALRNWRNHILTSFRVNQLMKRISNFRYAKDENLNPRKKVSGITACEPFEEYERTGILFADHADHYLKKKPEVPVVAPKPRSSKASGSNATRGSQSLDSLDQSILAEWGGEDYEDKPTPKRISADGEQTRNDLGILLRRNSMNLARRFLGLDPTDQTFKPQRNTLLQEFLDRDDVSGLHLTRPKPLFS